jgi:hypothetical protein
MNSKELMNGIKEVVEQQLNVLKQSGINTSNLDYAYKLVDIHKDIENEEYWKVKEDVMRYREYGRYSDGSYGRRGRDSRGRYTGNYPEDRIDEMYMNYQAYSEGKDAYGRSGNYSAKEDSMMCLEHMLESMVDFVKMLKEEANSQEEMELIRKYVHKLSDM